MNDSELSIYINKLKSGGYSKSRGILLSMILDRDKDFKRHDPNIRKQLGLDNIKPSANG